MRLLLTLLLATASAWGQANQGSTAYVGYQNMVGASWRPPETVVGSLPSAASNTGKVYVVTDGDDSADCTSGGGSTRALCVSTGSAWAALGGAGGAGGGGSLTKVLLRPIDNEPPASNPATFDLRNGHPVLDFDATTAEYAVFTLRIPEGTDLTGGLDIIGLLAFTSATTGGAVLAAEVDLLTGVDLDSAASFDTAVESGTIAASGTSGIPTAFTIPLASGDLDGAVAGDTIVIRISRVVSAGGDDATGDAEFVMAEVRQGS